MPQADTANKATYAESWLKVEESLGGTRPVLKGSPEEMRSQFSGLMSGLASLFPPKPPNVTVTDGAIGELPYRVFIPTGSSVNGPLPVGIYYHPGGFVIGQSDFDEAFCYAIASEGNTIVVSVQYRLSPEHKSPAHLEDALKILEWTKRNAASFGGDAARIYTMGCSAGAGLAFAAARKVALGQTSIADRNAVKGVVSFSPCVLHPDNVPESYKQTHTSFRDNFENTPLVDGTAIISFFESAGLDPNDKDYFFALDQEHVGRFPPTYIVTCEIDPLRDDGINFARSLREAGVPVRSDHFDGLPHCFWLLPHLPESQIFLKRAIEGIEWVIHQMV